MDNQPGIPHSADRRIIQPLGMRVQCPSSPSEDLLQEQAIGLCQFTDQFDIEITQAPRGLCPHTRKTNHRKRCEKCAFITGTFCEEVLQGTYRDKSKDCWDCEFYRTLRHEHGAAFSMPAFALHLQKRNKAEFDIFQRENNR